ncbi:Zn(2)-C6 fungal-type DNA-binding domain [Paramyrothecium foliicola]|nr:Zn(2)-C6 fungal-type DNA-binding domain [Paramyrothecium foliicola]
MRAGIRERCTYVVQGPARPDTPLSPAQSSRGGSARHSPVNIAREGPPARPTEALPLSRADGHAGFLGATSFSAVFRETQNSLSMLQSPEVANGEHAAVLDEVVSQLVLEMPLGHPPADHTPLEQALEILRDVPSKEQCSMIMTQDMCLHHTWSQLAAHRLVDSLWDTWGTHLNGRPAQGLLKDMAKAMCANTAVPLAESHADPNDWFQAFAGPNLRWEALGILFAAWASGSMTLVGHAVTEAHKSLLSFGKRKLLVKYKENAWKCAEMCRASGNRNSLLVYLLYKHSLLQSMVSGDASWDFWKLHSEVVSFTTFLGFHETPKPSPSDRSISTQIKRRIFTGIFINDKLVAAFNGRPPLLSRNYMSAALPLDISDEILLNRDCSGASDAELRIDEHGWNIDGQLYPVTIVRARAMLAFIRDAILEVALPDSSVSHQPILLNLLEREMRTVASFPSVLVLQEGDIKSPAVNGSTLFTRLLVRLEHLQNLFFIERLVSKETNTVSSQLLVLSLEMVTLTLAFWTHQDRLDGRVGDFEWLVMCYAAPAGGVLCTELLSPSSSRAGTPPVTRSNIIQQLSLLFGFLDWVGPTAPNGDLCSSVKQVIKRVLDVALNVSADAPGLMDEVGTWDMGFSADLNEQVPSGSPTGAPRVKRLTREGSANKVTQRPILLELELIDMRRVDVDTIERAKTPSREDALAARLKSLRGQSEASPPPPANKSPIPSVGSSGIKSAGNQVKSPQLSERPDAKNENDADAMFETDDQTLEELLGDVGPEDTFTQEPDDDKVKALLEELSQAVPKDDEVKGHRGDERDDGGDSDDSDGEHMSREVRDTIERLQDEAELEEPGHKSDDQDEGNETNSSADLALPSVPSHLADLPAANSARAGSADIDDITARMAALRAPTTAGGDDDDDDDDDALNLPSVPTSRPSGKPVKRLTSRTGYTDDDADGWCTVCLEDATLRCLGCDGDPYCTRCWREMHVGPAAGFDERSHRAVQLTRSRKKEGKVALGA